MIGPNGSGKSNFIRFFEMMSWMVRARRLAEFVEKHGGPTISYTAATALRPAWRWRSLCAPNTVGMTTGSS